MTEEEQTTDSPEGEDVPFEILDIAGIFFNQAAMALGSFPSPVTGERMVSFEAAQESISLIEVLRKKTEGNLTDEEEQAFETMIRELKMAYVHAIKDPAMKELAKKTRDSASGPPPQETESNIVTPDGRPASEASETPKIIVP